LSWGTLRLSLHLHASAAADMLEGGAGSHESFGRDD
jgi:hypothetical protein